MQQLADLACRKLMDGDQVNIISYVNQVVSEKPETSWTDCPYPTL